jgi:hypothetical protein
MKKITLLFLLLASAATAQTWNLSAGVNTTKFVFSNALGQNPDYMKSGAGNFLSLSFEKPLSPRFQYDAGLVYSQYNSVGDVQNIPFSYQTDFIGLTGGVGPKLDLPYDLKATLKGRASLQKMVNGNQFLQNQYIDLSDDDQFSGVRFFLGFSLELERKVNQSLSVFTQFQHLDTIQFGASSLNFVPSTFSFGLKIQSK